MQWRFEDLELDISKVPRTRQVAVCAEGENMTTSLRVYFKDHGESIDLDGLRGTLELAVNGRHVSHPAGARYDEYFEFDIYNRMRDADTYSWDVELTEGDYEAYIQLIGDGFKVSTERFTLRVLGKAE